MNTRRDGASMDALFRAVLALKNEDECSRFFDDLCTISELQAMKQRFEVALMLDKGQIYSEIAKETGASTATISRVNKCLRYGSGGYRAAIEKIKSGEGT